MPNYDEITKSAYREMELHLISSMKRNLGLHIAEEIKTGKEYPQWQAIKLRELRRYQKENSDIIKRSVGSFPEDVAKQLENELKQGAAQEQHRHNIAKGVTMDTAMGEGFFRLNRNKLEALQKSVNNDLSNANNAVLRMMNDTYRSTIYKYELFLANGAYTPTQAYDAAVKDFLERGINCIEYKDGRRVNIADYTDMAIKTANKRAQLMGEGSFRKSIGNPLIIMSAHNTSCKLCKPFQNKVLIDDVYSGGTQEDGDYMLLSEAMERGLYHPRCKHGCGTYYPEIEHINQYETPDNKLNDYGDKAINAAHIDNMIQRYKRLVAGSVDKNNIEKYQQQLKLWEQEKTQKELIIKQNDDILKVKEALAKNTEVDEIGRLPNSMFASTTQSKIQGYFLNSNHPVGKHKARVMNSVLGFNYNNWQELSDIIYREIQNNPVSKIVKTKFGTRYTVNITVLGKKNKSMVLKTVWQIDNTSNIPRLITITFNKNTIKEMK